ncbi:PREDICTED: uncharacterized protein C20orf96 homolog [Aptenodytes forsteri]|uniref:uncharacterized protein C20orf96 homolog n=1 Tax=Aptenodytes forsteri TaxID=9233 RepID=UPI0004F4B168|nr:PREDICTED: uncharacterized protein C20orf96 homolog [Aptenodytes forsteri]
MLSKKPPLPSETSPSQEKYRSFTQRKLALRKAELAKTLEEIKITTNLTNLKKNAIEELKQRSARLAETNCRLIKDIQHTDDSTAKQARVLLQQYEAFQRVKATVQTFNQNRLDTARAELQEMEKTMEKNLGRLQQQLDEVTSKVQVLQDELGILRTYIDGRYPEQAVQIVLLQRSIQSLKEQQQEEIDKTEEMGKAVLEELEEKARAEQEALLQKVVEEMLLHQDGLKQMVINNHVLRCEILRQREIIKDLEEEIGELKRSIQTLRQSARDPRELIFADVLLRRPKCTPDTEVVLSIPTEETPLAQHTAQPGSDEAPSCEAPPFPSALLHPSPAQPPWGLTGVVTWCSKGVTIIPGPRGLCCQSLGRSTECALRP